MTAMWVSGTYGANAARLAALDPKPKPGRLFENQSMEELSVLILGKQIFATLTNAKVLPPFNLSP